MTKFYLLISLFFTLFVSAQLPNIDFNGTNSWSTNSSVVFNIAQNQTSITSNGSNNVITSITKTITNPPNVFYILADIQFQNVVFDPATIKNPNIVVRNQAGTVIYRYTMKDNLNLTWFKAGIKIENYTDSQITVEFGVNKAAGTMLVKNPIFSLTPPVFSYEFPFEIPSNTSTTLDVNLSQKHNFENDLLSSNTHFVFAQIPWSNSAIQNAISNYFPMNNLRFPGGTVGNYYNFQTDNFYNTPNTPSNLISYNNNGNTLDYNGYRNFVTTSGATSTYMLNVMQGTVQTAKNEYLNRFNSNLPIKWIELGNEMYLTENQVAANVIDIASYISHTQQVVNEIKTINPTAKVAICAEKDDFSIGEWNHVLSQNQSYFDAATLHNYIATDMHFYSKYISYGILTSYKRSMKRFLDYSQLFPNKPLLLTEWGITGNVNEPYFLQTLGIADAFLAIEKANQMNIVKQAGIHMLYKNNVNDTATLLYFNNGNLMLTSKGKLYSKLFEVFKNSEVFDAEVVSFELESNLKAVNARMVKKGNQYKIFAVNKLPVTSQFILKINGVNYNGDYSIESYSENMSNPVNGIPAASNSWNNLSLSGNINLQANSISIITINIQPIIWSNQSWSNSIGPSTTLDAVIDDNLSTASDLACKDLTINSGKTLTIGPGKKLTVTGNLINNGTIVFKSDATGTAMFDVFNGSQSGTGVVTVERFIPQGKRAFRLLSPAVTTSTFISGNWQQGTHITGGATGGFDVTDTNNPSMYTYNNQVASGTGWTAIANTNATNLTAGVGYRVLVRGDRTPTNITSVSADAMNAATTLTATGTLTTGTVILNSSSIPAINNTSNTTTADYSLIGNPYQSPVNWNAVTKSGIDATYYAWDPNMGTSSQRGRYVAYNGTTNDNASSQVGQYIQPGQAFFVKNTVSGTAGTLTFQEAHKATISASVFRTLNIPTLSLALYDPNELAIGGYPIDATKAVFSSDYTNEIGLGDATKLESAGENIAWFRNNTKLAIDAAVPLSSTDELLVKTLRLSANKRYTLKVQTSNFDANLTPYLVDNFLNTQTEIATSQAFLASFVTTSNLASYNEDRFKIVFTTSALHNDTFTTQIGLYPNPSKGNVFNLQLPSSAEVSVKLFNTLGQEIGLTNNGNTYQAVQSLPTGMYYIKVTQGAQTSKIKWVVIN